MTAKNCAKKTDSARSAGVAAITIGRTSQLSGSTADFSGGCDGFCDGFLLKPLSSPCANISRTNNVAALKWPEISPVRDSLGGLSATFPPLLAPKLFLNVIFSCFFVPGGLCGSQGFTIVLRIFGPEGRIYDGLSGVIGANRFARFARIG